MYFPGAANRFTTFFVKGGAGKHNHQRLTRILTFLSLFDLSAYQLGFNRFLCEVARQNPRDISSRTRNDHWVCFQEMEID